jgi:hypothetical protein
VSGASIYPAHYTTKPNINFEKHRKKGRQKKIEVKSFTLRGNQQLAPKRED